MKEKENNIKDSYDIETEYLGSEETKYEGNYNTYNEETEYIEIKTGKVSKDTILNQRYKIVDTIGRGGMGAVYKALDIRLRNIPVAIKEISLETIEDERIEKVIQNFENEAQTLISLRHNAIPRVMDFFSLSNNRCYIVMDLIDGENLEQVIKRRGGIPENEVRNWIYQIADVLKYLHSREPKIIFRDLKPSNVMLTKENEIKLIDFGIARTFKDDKSTDTTYYVSQGFSPPEQYGTGQSDERSDIYSLGALAYSLLIGGKPKIKDFKFEDLNKYIDVSNELNNAIILSTDFRPENRPQTIYEFMQLLSNKDNQINSKNKFNKNKNIVATVSIVLIFLVVSKLNVVEKIINKDNDEVAEKHEYNSVNTINTQEQDNILNNSSENKQNWKDKDTVGEQSVDTSNSSLITVETAINRLHEVTGTDKNDVTYEINQYYDRNVLYKNYYVFDGFTEAYQLDTPYLVNKIDNSVYVMLYVGAIVPYNEYYNTSTLLGKYYIEYNSLGYDEIPEKTKKFILENGPDAFNNRMNEILKNANSTTLDYYGLVDYVDNILDSITKEELDYRAKNFNFNNSRG